MARPVLNSAELKQFQKAILGLRATYQAYLDENINDIYFIDQDRPDCPLCEVAERIFVFGYRAQVCSICIWQWAENKTCAGYENQPIEDRIHRLDSWLFMIDYKIYELEQGEKSEQTKNVLGLGFNKNL